MPTTPPSSAMTTGRYVRMVLLLGTLMTLTPLSIDMYLPALPHLAAELSATTSQAQGTVTGMLVGMGLGQLIVGPLSDMWGRRRPLLAGVIAHIAMSIGIMFTHSIHLMLVLRVLQGLAGAAVTVVVMACVTDQFTGRRASAMFSQLILVLGVAPIFAPSLGSALIAIMPWRGLFLFLVVYGVLIFLLAWFALAETHPPERRSRARLTTTMSTYRTIVSDPVYISMLVANGLQSSSLFIYVSLSSFVFQDVYQISPQWFGVAFGTTALIAIGVLQTNALLLRRFSPARILRGSLIIGLSVALVTVTLAGLGILAVVTFTVLIALTNASSGLAGPNSMAIAMRRNADRAGQASALMGASRFAVAGLVAPVVGLLPQTSSIPMTAAISVALLLALVATGLVWRRLDTPDYD